MSKKVDQIREALTPKLEPDEELCSVGMLTSGPMSMMQAKLFIGIGTLLFLKVWQVGVTQRRVIFVRQNASGKPDYNMQFATPLSNVKLNGKGIAIITPEEGMPQNFRFEFPAARFTGLDLDEFKAALSNVSPVTPIQPPLPPAAV